MCAPFLILYRLISLQNVISIDPSTLTQHSWVLQISIAVLLLLDTQSLNPKQFHDLQTRARHGKTDTNVITLAPDIQNLFKISITKFPRRQQINQPIAIVM